MKMVSAVEGDVGAVEETLRDVPGDLCRKAIASGLLMYLDGDVTSACMFGGTLSDLVRAQIDRDDSDAVDDSLIKTMSQVARVSKMADDMVQAMRPEAIAMMAANCLVDLAQGDIDEAQQVASAMIAVAGEGGDDGHVSSSADRSVN